MSDIKRFTFRLPSDLYAKIEEIAKENHRSTTAEIIVAIEKFVETHQLKKEPDFSNKSNDD